MILIIASISPGTPWPVQMGKECWKFELVDGCEGEVGAVGRWRAVGREVGAGTEGWGGSGGRCARRGVRCRWGARMGAKLRMWA